MLVAAHVIIHTHYQGGRMTQAIQVTPAAVRKVWGLLEEGGDFSLKLRAYVTGGGCQGLQYGFAFESEMEQDDLQLSYRLSTGLIEGFVVALLRGCSDSNLVPKGRDDSQVSLLVDPISFPYLDGSEIDYIFDAHGERFVVRNPNAKTTCGCDRSFTPVS